ISDWRSCSNAPIKNERRVDESRRLRAWQTRFPAPVCRNAPQRRAFAATMRPFFVAALRAFPMRLRRHAAARAARTPHGQVPGSGAALAALGSSSGSLGVIRQLVRFVGAFPGELGLSASEVSVGGGLLIDGPYQVQHLAQPIG